MKDSIITLSNGKRVANFSSPHPFTFTDGSVLPAVSHEVADALKVTFIEKIDTNGDVELSFSLSLVVLKAMNKWQALYKAREIDVVFCPLPMITAIKEMSEGDFLKNSPFRAIRIEDRVKKLVSIEKQCI